MPLECKRLTSQLLLELQELLTSQTDAPGEETVECLDVLDHNTVADKDCVHFLAIELAGTSTSRVVFIFQFSAHEGVEWK